MSAITMFALGFLLLVTVLTGGWLAGRHLVWVNDDFAWVFASCSSSAVAAVSLTWHTSVVIAAVVAVVVFMFGVCWGGPEFVQVHRHPLTHQIGKIAIVVAVLIVLAGMVCLV